MQTVFVFHLFSLLGKEKWQYWILTAVSSWLIFSLSNFNQLILSNISVAFLLFLSNKKPAPKYFGLVLTAFAFYIKAYVAIIAGTLTFSLLALNFFWNKNYKQTFIDVTVLLGSMLLLWMLIYKQLGGFINYCIGMIHLAGDNSAAAAYYPNNNWWLITPFLIIIGSIAFLQKTRKGNFFGFLFSLSFFATWKYGMAREDYYHARTFLYFIVVSMILFLIYNHKKRIINTPIILGALVLFTANMRNVENPQPLVINYSGIENFIRFVSSFQQIREASDKQNTINIASNRLPETVRNQIGNASVDIYPWDYTIIAANQLNWKPRPVIQSYAAYTSWLDKKNAVHFSSANAPEYFIFGLNNITPDLNGGKLVSIDNRYLLNDEPQTLIELIKNYSRVYSNENFLVYRKRVQALDVNSLLTETLSTKWNEWITVPNYTNQLTRLKLHIGRSFSGNVKSFLYKDELYYMYFKTKDGSILKYRIVPQNAADGIWISPFYTSAGNYSPSETITEALLTCSDKKMVESSVNYEWEHFDIDTKTINNFFGKDSTNIPEIYVNESILLESDNPNWNGFDPQKVITDRTNNQKFYQLKPTDFSPSFKLDIDSLLKTPKRITVDCWIKTDPNDHSTLVIETESITGEKNWQGIEINRQIIDQDELNLVFSYIDLNSQIKKVTIYICNNGNKPVSIYSMNIKLLKTEF
ncbi:MAG: hypothetical protein K0M50_13595 [Prolixibacteraceae bacterium]|nr:hypothetical protein [Prolixibacteraceae bacterium]